VPTGERGNVVVKESKLGFTCSVLTSASGEVLLTQFIYKGKTERVHVGVNQNDVLECHREDSHFQNMDTWNEWLGAFAGVLKRRGDQKSLLIIDAAPQHALNDTKDELLRHNCGVVQVPPAQTHVFQPADQYIIKAIKEKSRSAWDEWLAVLFQDKTVDDAVKAMTATSHPLLRERKVRMIIDGVDAVSKKCVVDSWAVCVAFFAHSSIHR
jgi:hypothetical protein